MAKGNKRDGSRNKKGKKISLIANNRRPMMRLRKTSEREYQFHFEEPVERGSLPQEVVSEYSSDASSQAQGPEIPSRVPDASRPLMRMRVPTKRTFAFSLPHSLNRTQKKDTVNSDISESSQEDSSISFSSTHPKEAEKENTIPSKRRHTIASFTESLTASSHRPDTNKPVIASTSTARPYENLDTPALHEKKAPAVRNLISKFSSSSVQGTSVHNVSQMSRSPEKKRSYSYRKEDILISENEDRPDIYASFAAQSDTDLVPDSEESDVPSNSQINLVTESQNPLKSVTEKVSLAEELSLIKSQVDSIRNRPYIEQTDEASNAATEVSQSSNATAVSVGRKNRSNLRKNMKNIAEEKMYQEKILNTTINSTKPKISYPTARRSATRRHLTENTIMLISPHNSKNMSRQSSSLRAINDLGSDFGKQNNVSAHPGVQEQLSESLDSAPDSSDLEGSISHQERKTMPKVVEEKDDVDDADGFLTYSDLDDTQSLDIQIQPPSVKKKKFYHPTFKADAYLKRKVLPSDLDFEVEELVSVDRKFFGSAPRKQKPKPPVQSATNGTGIATIEDILVYKSGGKSRDMTSITDLEVALTVIHNVIAEFRENSTDSVEVDLLKKYEKNLVNDLTDVIKKSVELLITRKRNNQLERSIRELSKEVGLKIDRRIMLQSELVALQREEEDQTTSETVSSVQKI